MYNYDFLPFCFLTDKLTSDAALDPAGLVAVAVCHGFALFVAVAVGANISGGHVNPAVTFGLAVGGQITILTGLFYWIAQLLGAIAASFLLSFVTGGLVSQNSFFNSNYKNFSCMFYSFLILFFIFYFEVGLSLIKSINLV